MNQTNPPDWDAGALEEQTVIEYRAVSGLAVAGLAFGVASAAAVFSPAMWILPAVGIVLSLLALWRISANSSLMGRNLAVVGLVLSTACAAMIPADWLSYRWLVHRESQQVATLWFDSLRDNKPEEAFQLLTDARKRLPMRVLRTVVRTSEASLRYQFEAFLAKPEVRFLLAAGKGAQVRYYATEYQTSETYSDGLVDVYAVSYEEGGQEKTFFVRLALQRKNLSGSNDHDWQIVSSEGGCQPVAMGGVPHLPDFET